MTVTCCIRYVIDPFQRDAFEAYARNWLSIIPACGGDLLGYFLPHEGTNNEALALISFDSLAAYEAYRARLRADPAGAANFAMAMRQRFILSETRTFLQPGDGAAMIAVLFEATPAADGRARYLELAAALAPQLAQVDGFISLERFESLSTPGRLLSLSFWRDEAAVAAWRNLESHRSAQGEGRAGVFSAYRLRVAAVIRDYGLDARAEAPADSRR